MATSDPKSISLQTVLHYDQETTWPKTGRHILAHYDEDSIVVYQAFCPEIADYALQHGQFGGPKYNPTRMTWIKTNFLWMMYRSGWATKKNQERILAIFLKKEGFDSILRGAKEAKAVSGSQGHSLGPGGIRLQWDPDHGPNGEKKYRRAAQFGLKGKLLSRFHQKWIIRIEDITDFVQEQYVHIKSGNLKQIMMPRERVYMPSDIDICQHIRLDGIPANTSVHRREKADNDDDKDCLGTEANHGTDNAGVPVTGACCSELLDNENITKTFETKDEVVCVGDVLKSSLSLQPTTDVIIGLGGAFNPVHTGHIQTMVETKAWLEENTSYRVVAGILAAAPDGYVRQKCRKSGHRFITGEHRIKLCELACSDYDWLQPYKKPTGSSSQGLKSFRTENGIAIGHASIAVVIGADRAINKAGKAKWHSEKAPIIICIGREGETTKIKDAFAKDMENGKVKNTKFFLLPLVLDNINSSCIRDKLQKQGTTQEDRRDIVKDFVEQKWLHSEVGQYIIEHEDHLYE